MRAVAVALLLEEQRGEIVAGWRRDVEHELGGEPALAFAVGPLLREMSLALRGDASPFRRSEPSPVEAAGARSALLVRSGAASGRVAREFKVLHRAIWDALKRAGAIVGADERRAADEWLDEALSATLDRQDRLRTRADLLDGSPAAAAASAARATPPWEPDARPVAAAVPAAPSRRPPPLPTRAAPPAAARPPVRAPVIGPARSPLARPPLRPPQLQLRTPPIPVAEPEFSELE